MLRKRIIHDGAIYVLDDETYFYSLLYHVLIQKHSVSPDYMSRLRAMGHRFGHEVNEGSLLTILEGYMFGHGYTYTFPDDDGVIFDIRRVGVSRKLFRKNRKAALRRIMFRAGKFTARTARKILRIITPGGKRA